MRLGNNFTPTSVQRLYSKLVGMRNGLDFSLVIMDCRISGRLMMLLVILLCCFVPTGTSADFGRFLQENDEIEDSYPIQEYLGNPFYNNNPLNLLGTHLLTVPRATFLKTNRQQFVTTKRAWDVIQRIWQPQLPKRAWEFVNREWRDPKYRTKFIRSIQPIKRSKEIAVNLPIPPESRMDTDSFPTVYGSQMPDYQAASLVDNGQILSNDDWNSFVKDLFCKCCIKHLTIECCAKCKVLTRR